MANRKSKIQKSMENLFHNRKDLYATASDGSTPFFLALARRDEELVHFLVDQRDLDIHRRNQFDEHVLTWIYRTNWKTADNFMMKRLNILDSLGFDFQESNSTENGSLFMGAAVRGQFRQMQFFAQRNLFLKPEQEERSEALVRFCAKRGAVNLKKLDRMCDESRLFDLDSIFSKEMLISLAAWLNYNKLRRLMFNDQRATAKSILWNLCHKKKEANSNQSSGRPEESALARSFEQNIISAGSPFAELHLIMDQLKRLKLDRFRKALQSEGWKLIPQSIVSELITSISKRFHVDWLDFLLPEKTPYELLELIDAIPLKSYLFTLASGGKR